MSSFKPMVKMMTDEPSVILKLKKGGKVHHKHEKHEEHGHKAMHHAAGGMMHGAHEAFESEHGHSPKKPSMGERRKAMNPQMYKKGGNVTKKAMGGGMPMGAAPMGAPMAAPMAPMARPALAQMAPAARMARAAMVRKALTGMKKGGSAGMEKHIEKLEKELHHHESMPMSKAHHEKHGGKIHHKASGGAIDRDETRTTIESGAKKFEKTKVVDGSKHDKHHGTGEIHDGKPAGYKHGGKVHHVSGHPEGSHEHHKHMAKHHAKMHKEGGSAHHKKMHEHHKAMCSGGMMHKATGGSIPADTDEKVNKGRIKMKGTIEGNEHDYVNTEMHQAKRDKAHGTGGIKESNAGGFKRGGKVPGIGNAIEHDGDWENRAANGTPKGMMNGTTGGVRESNAGGYKHGGHAAKKHFATGGNVVDDGKAVKMPHHFISRPVANSMQSGTFKKGGKVKHFETGDRVIDNETARMAAEKKAEREENEGMRNTILGAPGRAFDAVKSLFGSQPKPAGSVTKTEKSVTVEPRKRGGRC